MTAVLLMTMGDPSDLDGVFPYMRGLFSDPLIVPAPAPVRYLLSYYIPLKKLSSVKARYKSIGGGSPMNAITERQAEVLEDKLNASGAGQFKVYPANRYCPPTTEEAFRRAKRDGAEKLVALPLYPHYSPAITGSSFRELVRLMESESSPPAVWIKGVAEDGRFVSALAEQVRRSLGTIKDGAYADMEVVLSAHSLPRKFIDGGDPYMENVCAAADALGRELGISARLGFQSKGRAGMEWLKPETETVLQELAAAGKKDVVLVPISFVSENIETLYDCDVAYMALARSLGMRLIRVPCLNADPVFIAALSSIVLDALKSE